jgi:hypothetical protein
VAVAAFSVLSENISIEIPDLVRATANSFGFSRVGQNVEGSMLVGIEYMIQNFPVNKEGERVVCTQ